jgi:hypothetical protein
MANYKNDFTDSVPPRRTYGAVTIDKKAQGLNRVSNPAARELARGAGLPEWQAEMILATPPDLFEGLRRDARHNPATSGPSSILPDSDISKVREVARGSGSAPLDVPGGEGTQRLIEAMTPSGVVNRAEIQRLMAEIERTNPNSPALARAKAALKAEGKDGNNNPT